MPMCPNRDDCTDCYVHSECPDSWSLGTECRAPATVPLWFKVSTQKTPTYYCPDHAASVLRRLPNAFVDHDPN